MYLAALHVVRPQTGAEGINAFCYLHKRDDWIVPPNPERDPGDLERQRLDVEPLGGNRVRSYLNVVAPDGASWNEIRNNVLVFMLDHERQAMPWSARVGRCMFQLGMEQSLAMDWAREAQVLWSAVQAVRAG